MYAKYNPYWGYGSTIPGYWYRNPKRIRTRSDWRPDHDEPDIYHGEHVGRYAARDQWCKRCQKVHCYYCHCDQPWKRSRKSSGDSVYEKRDVHRRFRLAARNAIRRELAGDDNVMHNFRISGDWLD